MNTKNINGFEEYLKAKGVNWSTLRYFFKSPAHVKEQIDNPVPPSDSMRLGTTQHVALLEPEKLVEEYIAAPDFGSLRKNDSNGTTSEQAKENREAKAAFYEEHKGKTIIPAKEFAALVGMSKSVYAHSEARELLKSVVETEKAIFWTDRDSGIECKGLLDCVSDKGVLIDIKTSEDCRYQPH